MKVHRTILFALLIVAAFLGGRLPYLAIVDTVAVVVDEHLESGHGNPTSVDDVLSCERWARSRAHDLTGGSA